MTVYLTHDQGEAMVASNRIAVMNGGRIEQIDAPYDLYLRPRTRFVATFIGRTNLLEARCDGPWVRFDGFELPRAVFPVAMAEQDTLMFSARPQTISLHLSATGSGARCLVAARLLERVFLSESWDYVARPEGSDARLKISTLPHLIFEPGADVWLGFDPTQMCEGHRSRSPIKMPVEPLPRPSPIRRSQQNRRNRPSASPCGTGFV